MPTDPAHIQVEKKNLWNATREKKSADFFTVGYSGRRIDDFLKAVIDAGVRCVIDVRHMPVSMYKPDFSKSNLTRHLLKVGVEYLHLPDLGVPRDIRSKSIGHSDRNAIWEWYDQYVVQRFCGHNLHRFFNVAEHPIAFMCTEIDPTSCHRHRLALALEKSGLKGFDA